MRDLILDAALQIRGTVKRIAQRCGISTAAVSRWRRVPKRRVDAVAEVTGIRPEKLRPDLYEKPVTRKTKR